MYNKEKFANFLPLLNKIYNQITRYHDYSLSTKTKIG